MEDGWKNRHGVFQMCEENPTNNVTWWDWSIGKEIKYVPFTVKKIIATAYFISHRLYAV